MDTYRFESHLAAKQLTVGVLDGGLHNRKSRTTNFLQDPERDRTSQFLS
jgi:hypothetical protein